MDKVKLNVEPNPKQIEMFDTALGAWKQEHVQRRMKEMFLIAISDCEFGYDKLKTDWSELKKELVKDLDPDLAFVIKQTGQRIYDWIYYMRERSCLIGNPQKDDHKKKYFGINNDVFINYCLDEIHWTKHGFVDESKTICLGWLDKPDIDDFKKFCLACFVCDEPLIDLFWEKLPNDVKASDYSHYMKHWSTYIIAYFISLKKSTLQTFINDLNLAQDTDRFDENKSAEENILNRFSKGYVICYARDQYLMKKLSYETVQKNISVWFRNYSNIPSSHKCEVVPMLLFLYNEMSEDAMQNTFLKQDEFKMPFYKMNTAVAFLELLSSYPFQELLAPALNQLQPYLKNSDYTSVFESVTKRISSKKDVILEQLPHLWEVVPASAKEQAALVLLHNFFKRWDIPSMKIILNDKDLTEKRETLLRIGYEKFMEFAWKNKYDMINQFIDEILILENWEDDAKSKVKRMYQILMIDLDVKSAEGYLDSQFNKSDSYMSQISSFLSTFISSEEDRKNFMKKINHEILFYYFLGKQNMELIREYFEKIYPDDLNTFKESIKNNPFTLKLIYKIWIQWNDLEHGSPETFCNELLLWMFSSNPDDVLAFKKNVLLKDLKNKTSVLFTMSNRFDIVPDLLLSWCFCTAKEIRKIRSRLLRFAVPLKFAALMKNDDLVTSKKLLDWAFRSEKNKRKFKSRFIVSKKGILALGKLIETMKSEETDQTLKLQDISKKFKDYIHFWMESFEDMTMVRRCLVEYREFEKIKEEGVKIKLDSEGGSTTFENTEAESSDDEIFSRHYFYYESVTFDRWSCNRFSRGKKNLDLFLKMLDESIKEKLRDMKMSKK